MKKLSITEIICYAISGAIAVAGFVFLIIALVASFSGTSGNDLEVFFIPGYICLPVGAALLSMFLLIFAKTSDKAIEAAARRAARLGKTEKPKEEPAPVVEEPKEAAPVEEAPVEEPKVEEEKPYETAEEEITAEENPEAPVEEPAPVEEAPVEEPKAEEIPVEEVPVEEPKAEEIPVEEVSAEEPKAE